MGYLICDTCNDVYKLQDGESPEDFDLCQCGGNLEYYETLQDFVDQFYNLSNFKSEDGNLLLKKGYNQLKKKNRDLEDEYSKLKDANFELESELGELKEFQDKLKAINREIEEENLDLKDKLTLFKDKSNGLGIENSQIKEEVPEKSVELDKKGSNLNENNLKVNDQYKQTNNDYVDLKKELGELRGSNQKLIKDLDLASIKLGNLRKFNNGLEAKNYELKQEILRLKGVEDAQKDLTEKYDLLKMHNNELINRFLELRENHNKLEADHEGLNQRYTDLETYNDKLLTKDSELSKSYSKLENRFSSLEKENIKLKESDNSDPELENNYKKLQEKFLKLEEENTELNGELIELKDNFSNLRDANVRLKESANSNQELENSYNELQEKYSELEKKNTDLAELEKLNEKLSKDNSRLETDFNGLKAKLSELEEENLNIGDNELKTNYYRLKVEHNNLKERYVALKNKNKAKTLKVDFSGENKDDGALKTHIVCEDCGEKLPLSQFYKTKSNERGYTVRCKSCTRKRNAAQGLVELSKYIELDTPFSKEELKNVTGDQPFSVFENYMWVLLELDILSYLEDEDKYVLRSDDNLKDFCGTYGISLAL